MSTDSSAAFTEDYGLAACPVSITTNPAGPAQGWGTPAELPQPLRGALLGHTPKGHIPEWMVTPADDSRQFPLKYGTAGSWD